MRHKQVFLKVLDPIPISQALLHNSQAVDNKNEFLWHFYNNFRLSQGQLKTYATTPISHGIIPKQLNNITSHEREISERCDTTLLICHGIPSMVAQLF
jgi:hypothetical protein